MNLGACALAFVMTLGVFGCKDAGTSGTSTTGSTTTGGSGGPAGNSMSGDTIKLGLVASLNGELRPWGQDSAAGAQLAVDEINAAGGIDGKKIELLTEDSNSKPEEGKSAAEKLASNGVLALVGEVASGITMQMKEVAKDKGIPLVAVGATNPAVTQDSNGLVTRVCYTDDLQGPVMAVFAFNDLKLRRIAVMTDQKQPYSQGLSKTFREKFEALGGKIVGEESYQSGETQFGGQITKIKAQNPDGVFMSGYFTEVGPMARQMRAAGMTTQKLLGGDGWDSSEIVASGGDAIINGYFCNHYNDKDDRPEVQSFLEKYMAKNNGKLPGTTMAALGYDATNLVIDALKRIAADKKSFDSKTLSEYINATEGFKAVSGDITLKDMNGDPPKRALIVSVQKAGQKFEKAYEPAEVLGSK